MLGFVSEVGVAGLTLGGGLGYLTRRFGWTVDNLEEVEIVTADGEIRTASRDENADLFWAVRGGGGNFGVVTRFTFRLHEVGPTVYGGLIAWPFERADEILRRLPDDHGRGAAGARRVADPAPRSAGAVRARGVARQADLCAWPSATAGDLDGVDEVLAPIRALGDPVVDLLARAAVHRSCSPTSTRPSRRACTTTGRPSTLAELSDELLSTVAGARSPSARSRTRSSASCTSAARSTSAPRTTGRSATATRASCSA